MYDASKFTKASEIELTQKTQELIEQANTVYHENFDGKTWYGRCIFFSWYCKKGTCTFCYRSTIKHKTRHAKGAQRSVGSMLVEALLCKKLHWRIEFLTGGYQEEDESGLIPDYARLISKVYGEKIWVNIGWISKENLELLLPYIKGVVSSIETPTPSIHKSVCPDKPIEPYEEMFSYLPSHIKRSACFIIGLGDADSDFIYWEEFIEQNTLDRITVYALKPVRGGAFEHGPTHDTFLSWIAKLRIRFPTLEIIGGTNLRRSEEVGYMIKAGVNAIKKFPATKQFGSQKAHTIIDLIKQQNRKFTSELLTLPDIDWHSEIELLDIEDEYKEQMHKSMIVYLESIHKSINQDN